MHRSVKVLVLSQATEVPDTFGSGMFCISGRGNVFLIFKDTALCEKLHDGDL